MCIIILFIFIYFYSFYLFVFIGQDLWNGLLRIYIFSTTGLTHIRTNVILTNSNSNIHQQQPSAPSIYPSLLWWWWPHPHHHPSNHHKPLTCHIKTQTCSNNTYQMSYGGGYTRQQAPSSSQQQYLPQRVVPSSRSKVRLRVSYNLHNSDQVHHRHCFGINSLAFNEDHDLLYSAGRDSTIRCWDVNKVFIITCWNFFWNIWNVILVYNMKVPIPEHLSSFEHHTDWINDIFLCNNFKTCMYLFYYLFSEIWYLLYIVIIYLVLS